MESTTKFSIYPLLILYVLIFGSCYKEPWTADYETIDGYVIGKETCSLDESQDHWLVDFSLTPNTPQVGDTLQLNGVTFTNVLKVKGLDEQLKFIGMKVSFDYRTITPSRVTTTGCTVSSTTTYALKELFILHQSELR